ncbi:SubName: Full=Uncharacterized protein {ECO:0000313/EMBL:CCA72111.1} [Serendipita indica DSM 11827]|uniref:Uncharacterized protein n=1 Tax=Serendipita indica (strain DSM 11827) TaxID=1109443 RepID=G4TLB8_SERID|nr:SubName: Full=Uncharacterized protein {ECO:0000313/EMBL:CCA72111.1} [Serendipita indica DSM 11827]CCA72111.1 hypothetical protein PIIN_06047 [Serendipita indica DSM 11827]
MKPPLEIHWVTLSLLVFSTLLASLLAVLLRKLVEVMKESDEDQAPPATNNPPPCEGHKQSSPIPETKDEKPNWNETRVFGGMSRDPFFDQKS